MSVEERRVCDVYGTQKNVRTFRIVLASVNGHERPPEPEGAVVHATVDLGPRALERLKRLIARGLYPGVRRKTGDKP